MNINRLSTRAIAMMHCAIRDALIADINSDEEVYGVRIFNDWAEHRDAIEAELHARGVPFVAIVW